MRRLALLIIVFTVLCGCRTVTRYVPAETASVSARSDTLYRSVWRTDSVIDRDTVVVADGVREVVHWRWRTQVVRDTLWRVAVDSAYVEVPYPVEVPVEVPRKREWWETAMICIGATSLLYVAGRAVWATARLKKL